MSEFKVWRSVSEIAADVASGKVKAIDNVVEALKVAGSVKDYNAIISTCEERALKMAKEIDRKVASGEKVGKLAGVPYVAKDNFLVFGADSTAGSNMLRGYNSPYQATVIERLEAEGAICVAKANLDAYGHGASTENSDFFVTKNPYDKSRVAGGSSGGSAAAVALGIAPFALGTDTGGSVRQPSSFCGVVGYKPTYGLVSRSGVVAMASSTDTIGAIARTVADVADVIDVISGKDEHDSTTIERDKKGYSKFKPTIKGKKIGVLKEYIENNQPDVKKAIDGAIKQLKGAGAEIGEVSLPSIDLALAVYYILVPAEISSNLSRYDGQRYQYSNEYAKTLEDSYVKSRTKGFGSEAKRRILIGTHVLSSGYYDAYYKKAQIVRTKLINDFKELFEKYDYIIGPVSPNTAFKIGETGEDPIQMYMQDIMTVAVSLVGSPAISVPCKTDGMPVGLQIMADQKEDRSLFEIAKAFEESKK